MMHPTIVAFEEGAAAMRRIVRGGTLLALAALAVFGVKACRERDAALMASARLASITDSLQRAGRQLQERAALHEARADSWMHVADSLQQVTEEIPHVIANVIATTPLPRASIIGDTVHLEGDTIPHVVDHPIAVWMQSADHRITHLTTLVRDTIRPAWNALVSERNALRSAVGELQGANLNLDSLVTAGRKANTVLRVELARHTPSRWTPVRRVIEVGSALYVGYRVGRGR